MLLSLSQAGFTAHAAPGEQWARIYPDRNTVCEDTPVDGYRIVSKAENEVEYYVFWPFHAKNDQERIGALKDCNNEVEMAKVRQVGLMIELQSGKMELESSDFIRKPLCPEFNAAAVEPSQAPWTTVPIREDSQCRLSNILKDHHWNGLVLENLVPTKSHVYEHYSMPQETRFLLAGRCQAGLAMAKRDGATNMRVQRSTGRTEPMDGFYIRLSDCPNAPKPLQRTASSHAISTR